MTPRDIFESEITRTRSDGMISNAQVRKLVQALPNGWDNTVYFRILDMDERLADDAGRSKQAWYNKERAIQICIDEYERQERGRLIRESKK